MGDERAVDLVRQYYTRYYRDQLGLPDWEARVASRLSEDGTSAMVIQQALRWTDLTLAAHHRVLVVGAGTGAELMALAERGCRVVGFDPGLEAVRIAGLKTKQAGLPPDACLMARAEAIPFASGAFDMIWCWTVVEHVQDVAASLAEMVRVLKPWGHLFIQTPDYRHFYEPHYKLALPMWAPRWVVRLLLWLNGRPVAFLDTLQFVTSRQLTNIFQDLPVVAFQVIQSWPESWKPGARRDWLQTVTYWIVRTFSIQRDQYWIVRKLDKPR